MEQKSFEQYFENFKCYDDGGDLDRGIVEDAKKVFEKLKTPQSIIAFKNGTDEKLNEKVGKLRDHSGFSFSLVCEFAREYAIYSEVFQAIANAKDKDGKAVFSEAEINDFFANCGKTVKKYPDKIMTVLDNPEEIEMITSYKNRGFGLWRSIEDPLPSTVAKNPEAFKNSEIQAEIEALKKQINDRLG